MAIIPSSTRFVGIAPSVNLTEKKSNQLNSETQPYTMQDFQDSISPDLSPIVVDGNSVGIDADPTVTLQQVAVIESLTANAGIVLKPNGTGAIMAQVPDGTPAGGIRGEFMLWICKYKEVLVTKLLLEKVHLLQVLETWLVVVILLQ